MTNYEKIKAMSVEEIRDFLISCTNQNRCFFFYECGGCVGECEYCVEHWLESEVEEDG